MAADPEASIALPFTPRPQMLTGELVGDVGFDPLNFSEEVSQAREGETGRSVLLGVRGTNAVSTSFAYILQT